MAWLASLLTAGSAALGRVLSVNLLPTALLATVLWLAARADAFSPGTHDLRLSDLFGSFKTDTGGVLLFVVLVFALAVLLQPFEIKAVRLLEGYWTGNRVGDALSRTATGRHARRLARARRDWDAANRVFRNDLLDPATMVELSVPEQAARHREWADRQRRARWARRVRPLYPDSGDLLPTLLGNVLRASERRSGDRYHLPTVDAFPRLYQHMSDRMSAAYAAATDALDAAAMMALSAAATALVCVVAFYDDPSLYWAPFVFALVAVLAYRGAIAAAAQQGVLLDAAFDLHRFDLVKALHLDLPANAEQERVLGQRLRRFWRSQTVEAAQAAWADTRYWHFDEKQRPGGRRQG